MDVPGLRSTIRGSALAQPSTGSDCFPPSANWQEHVLHLLSILVEPTTDIPTFTSAARSFRDVIRFQHVETSRSPELVCSDTHAQSTGNTLKARALAQLLEHVGAEARQTRGRDLALVFKIHPTELGRILRIQTGIGLREWLVAIRIRLAVHALVTPDLQIKQIASVGLIRFRGHLPKGGYDVPHVSRQARPAASPAIH